jgi:hypothetical protein
VHLIGATEMNTQSPPSQEVSCFLFPAAAVHGRCVRHLFDTIMATFVEDCHLETVALNLRIEGRPAARAAYEGYFTAFPDLTPGDEGFAFGKTC